jgi:hypothetical protein
MERRDGAWERAAFAEVRTPSVPEMRAALLAQFGVVGVGGYG